VLNRDTADAVANDIQEELVELCHFWRWFDLSGMRCLYSYVILRIRIPWASQNTYLYFFKIGVVL